MCEATDTASIVEAIRRGLESLDGDGQLLAELQAEGLKRVSTFTWERAAREALTLYREMAKGA
jgi:glycosyltransferase involved in cell wall biosynthesis